MAKKKASVPEVPKKGKGKDDPKGKAKEDPKGKKDDQKSKKDDSKGTKGKGNDAKTNDTDDNKPTRGRVIGDNFGWTGKLPATLLNEYCQKQKWGRVEYDIRKKGGGFVCTCRLQWTHPKTREIVHVAMTPEPPLYEPKETSNEARHYAATYTMYRINHVKNLKMVLPTIFADYWSAMEKQRQAMYKENRVKHDRMYNAHPFQVVLDERERNEKARREEEVRKQNELKVKKPSVSISVPAKTTTPVSKVVGLESLHVETKVSFPRKVWENAPFIDFPMEIRTSIESAIRQHIDWILDDHETPLDSSDKAKTSGTEKNKSGKTNGPVSEYLQSLVGLGFRELHVREAFAYTSTYIDALEWLLFHLPEDDLPPLFSKRNEDSKATLKISKNIELERLVARVSQSGCDHDDILRALAENEYDEVKASVSLTQKVAGFSIDNKDEKSEEDEENEDLSQDSWETEINCLHDLGTNVVEYSDESRRIATISLQAKGLPKGLLSVRVFKPEKYPHELPGIQIIVNDASRKLANYIKLALVSQASKYIIDSGAIGFLPINYIVEWLQDHTSSVIDNPGKLVDTELVQRERRAHSTTKSNKPRQQRNQKMTERELEAAAQKYATRAKSKEFLASLKQRTTLPAWGKREELVAAIDSNRVSIITGETGSGKSTQIVQFVLDALNAHGDFASRIMCTQPRRISTIGLADRISDERVDTVGGEVGYVIRGENKTSRDTRISFVTTGVLLRMLQTLLTSGGASVFDDLKYLFIDEVHERSVDLDFLLIILKKIMKRFPDLRVVLMSATINTGVFNTFFGAQLKHIHIEGRTFPIDDIYLDTILSDLDYTMTTRDGPIKPKADSPFFKAGSLNYDLISNLALHVHERLKRDGNSGSILIFLPGVLEISNCIREITRRFEATGADCWALPLHSALTSADQRRVFKVPGAGVRKIVVSTNVAETSITIPDCVAVIDLGRAKSMYFDPKLNATKLVEDWCSRAEIGQRRGRSGRVTNGTCYHLYTKEQVDAMRAQPVPEIKRTRLENLYLVVKAMGIDGVEEFLQGGLDAPEASSLDKARRFLHDIGALHQDGLSHLGKYLSFIPADLQSGKLLIFGCIFGCLDTCLTLAAVSSVGNPFLNNFEIKDKVKLAKGKFAQYQGDFVAVAAAFEEYERLRRDGQSTNKFLADNFLSYTKMKDIASTRAQYRVLLEELGFIDRKSLDTANRNNSNFAVVRSVITGAFYPQIAQVQLPDPKFFKSMMGAVALDPDEKKTRYWLRNDSTDSTYRATRAFLHPLSVLFGTSEVENTFSRDILEQATTEDGEIDYDKARALYAQLTPSVKKANPALKANFVVYCSSHQSSKLYLRDVTPTSTLATLLFGGELSYNLTTYIANGRVSPGIVMDNWMPIRTWCKNGVLIKRLRSLVDLLIEDKLTNPLLEMNADVQVLLERILDL